MKRCQQVIDDVVIVTCVQRNVISPGCDDGSYDIQCLVAIESGDFNGDNIRDFTELQPELMRVESTSHSRMQVEAKNRNDVGNDTAVLKDLVFRFFSDRIGGQQACMVAQ